MLLRITFSVQHCMIPRMMFQIYVLFIISIFSTITAKHFLIETYDEGMETDTKSEDYSLSHGNDDRHRHSNKNVDTHIMGMESNTLYGDYSSVGRSGCGVILTCNTTNERIKPGSCKFT